MVCVKHRRQVPVTRLDYFVLCSAAERRVDGFKLTVTQITHTISQRDSALNLQLKEVIDWLVEFHHQQNTNITEIFSIIKKLNTQKTTNEPNPIPTKYPLITHLHCAPIVLLEGPLAAVHHYVGSEAIQIHRDGHAAVESDEVMTVTM